MITFTKEYQDIFLKKPDTRLIEDLNMSNRLYNNVKRFTTITKVYQLIDMVEESFQEDIAKYRNFGPKSLQELQSIIDSLNIEWGTKSTNYWKQSKYLR